MLQCRGQGCSGVFLGSKASVGSNGRRGRVPLWNREPWAPPHYCPTAPHTPLAQDDLELRVVQAGNRHIRQLKLLQLSHNCGKHQLSSSSGQQEPLGPHCQGAPGKTGRPPTQGRVQAHSPHSRQGAGQMSHRSGLYSQEKAPSVVSLTRKRLK